MRFMNEWDIRWALAEYAHHPLLGPATKTLDALKDWADRNSDGWAYWPAPVKAARKLMELIERDGTNKYRSGARPDVTAAELKSAYTTIKSFRTKHRADFEIFLPAPRDPEQPAHVRDNNGHTWERGTDGRYRLPNWRGILDAEYALSLADLTAAFGPLET